MSIDEKDARKSETERDVLNEFILMDQFASEMFKFASPDTKKQIITEILGKSGETPEMTQMHIFENNNAREHDELKRDIRVIKYAIAALAASFLGIESLTRVLELLGI